MSQYVVIREMSNGNATVGDMWKETKIFPDTATLKDVMEWADEWAVSENRHSTRNIILTKAHREGKDECGKG